MDLDVLFEQLWSDYSSLNSQANKIHALLEAAGEKVVNDHVALRTFNHPRTGIQKLSRVFRENGYEEKGQYEFKEKKLTAIHLEYPEQKYPKVFISELLVEEFSDTTKKIITGLIDQLPTGREDQDDFCISKRPWKLAMNEYESLARQSEYAAWMSAFGFRANHFTVSVNHLKKWSELSDLNQFLKMQGFELNQSGGEIKGGEADCLEQSSTMADRIQCEFTDGQKEVPSCYYEFAKRYRDSSGNLYQGFVASSADKIFESTDRVSKA